MITQDNIVCAYLVNQLIDIFLWSWIVFIMIKRVICRGFNFNLTTIKEVITQYNFRNITKTKFKRLIINHYYISDLLLFIAAIIAVIQFSNQFYYHSIELSSKILTRTWIWMLFHKIITISILVRYKDSQPQIFYEVKRELKEFLTLKKDDSKDS